LYINALRASMKELHSMREALAWKITLGKYYARNMSYLYYPSLDVSQLSRRLMLKNLSESFPLMETCM
jgi:hypothetical protein